MDTIATRTRLQSKKQKTVVLKNDTLQQLRALKETIDKPGPLHKQPSVWTRLKWNPITYFIFLAILTNLYKTRIFIQNYRNNESSKIFVWQNATDQMESKTPPLTLAVHNLSGILGLVWTLVVWALNDKPRLRQLSEGDLKLTSLARTPTLRELQEGTAEVYEKPSWRRNLQFVILAVFSLTVIPNLFHFGSKPWYVGLFGNGIPLLFMWDGFLHFNDTQVMVSMLLAPMFEILYFIYCHLKA